MTSATDGVAPLPGRIWRVGLLARCVSIPVAVIAALSYFGWEFPRHGKQYGDPHILPIELLALTLTVFFVAMALRSLVIGVWLLDDRVIVRSWFRTRCYARDEGAVCSVGGYDGFFVRPGPSGYWSMLRFEIPGQRPWSARGSMARHAQVVDVAERLNAWVDPAAPTKLHHEPRHLPEN